MTGIGDPNKAETSQKAVGTIKKRKGTPFEEVSKQERRKPPTRTRKKDTEGKHAAQETKSMKKGRKTYESLDTKTEEKRWEAQCGFSY